MKRDGSRVLIERSGTGVFESTSMLSSSLGRGKNLPTREGCVGSTTGR